MSFNVFGGSNGLAYSLYRSTEGGAPFISTNWVWIQYVRSCDGVWLTNQPVAGAYYLLGGEKDSDGDEIPDSWMVQHFGHPTGLAGDNSRTGDDYDWDGVLNFDEYNAGSDPNTLRFCVQFDSLRVSADAVAGTIGVLRGVPANVAVLVDNTNFEAASWSPYASRVSVSLGSTDGAHDVWVGLKGRAETSRPTWEGVRLRRDTTAPLIVITNPVGATVSQSVLQLQGYSPEPLASLRYDVTNDAGSLSGLQGYVVSQTFDASLSELTTNWFECVDIGLALGTNWITLRAADRAGNVSTNVYTYIFAYPTAPPAMKIYWPQDNTSVSGTNFTLRGWVGDATATLTAQIVGGGQTNVAQAMVERDGKFWIENQPLAAGANTIFLSATDVAGNTVVTNIVVVKSSLELTITPLSESVLNQPFVTVGGTVNGEACKVWVNGVAAATNGGGSWTTPELDKHC